MTSVSIFRNSLVVPDPPAAGFAAESREPMECHRGLPGYAPTPLRNSPELAQRLGVAQVLVKDESTRLGLPSFKMLGASWATLQAVGIRLGVPVPGRTLDGLGPLARERGLALVAATDGNHGRGVARMAALLGVPGTILAVAAAAGLADDTTLVISDTSWPGYEDVPRTVVDGYSTMFHEIDDEIDRRGLRPPTVVAFQAGVGAFAAAGLRHYRAVGAQRTAGSEPVRTIVVEPTSAACLQESARRGELSEVPGPHRSTMAGLNCGRPSELVWPLVAGATDVFVAIDDAWSDEGMRALAASGVVAGESGAASLGAMLALTADQTLRAGTGLDPDASLLLVNTEGATDPENYRRVVGHCPPGAQE